MKLATLIPPKTLLLMALVFPRLLMPAFAQQEVDPTYYDPWAAAPKAAVHTAQVKGAPKKKAPVSMAQRTKERPVQVKAHVPHRTEQAALELAMK